MTSLAIAVVAVFAIQWIIFIPSYVRRTERYFDLAGAATYVVVTVGLAVASAPLDARSWLLSGVVVVWAMRLGAFLFARVRRAGGDARFDELKETWAKFLAVWTMQGVWIALTAAAAWVAISVGERVPIDAWAIVGMAVWVVGFTIEVAADQQKRRFKSDAANSGRYIATGLWAASRHPNYFGEILLWTGVALIAVPTLIGWQWLALVSPVFVTLLLVRVSGIPLLEARARERWSGQPDFERYLRETPVLVPRLSSLRRVGAKQPAS